MASAAGGDVPPRRGWGRLQNVPSQMPSVIRLRVAEKSIAQASCTYSVLWPRQLAGSLRIRFCQWRPGGTCCRWLPGRIAAMGLCSDRSRRRAWPGNTVVLSVRSAVNRGCRHSPGIRKARWDSLLIRDLVQVLNMLPRGNICLPGVLTQLQRADVRRNRPPILRCNLRSIIRHRAIAVRDDYKKVTQWCIAQPICVEVPRRPVATLHDHAVAVAHARVARRAIDVEPFLAARHRIRV